MRSLTENFLHGSSKRIVDRLEYLDVLGFKQEARNIHSENDRANLSMAFKTAAMEMLNQTREYRFVTFVDAAKGYAFLEAALRSAISDSLTHLRHERRFIRIEQILNSCFSHPLYRDAVTALELKKIALGAIFHGEPHHYNAIKAIVKKAETSAATINTQGTDTTQIVMGESSNDNLFQVFNEIEQEFTLRKFSIGDIPRNDFFIIFHHAAEGHKPTHTPPVFCVHGEIRGTPSEIKDYWMKTFRSSLPDGRLEFLRNRLHEISLGEGSESSLAREALNELNQA